MFKEPTTVQEQLALLQKRGMNFKNDAAAVQVLQNTSYYRLKGYWWEMQTDKVDHCFAPGSYFEDAFSLYNFDRGFRLLIFDAVERIEIALRTKIVCHMSLSYGPHWYLEPALFENTTHHSRFVNKIKQDISESSEVFIRKHFENHPDEIPESWKALEIITLGTLSKLFKNIKHQLPEKALIAKEFGLPNQKYLASWLLSITLVRNIVAHHSRLWNRIIINQYDWPEKTLFPLLTYKPVAFERRKIFPLFCALLYLNDRICPDHSVRDDFFRLLTKFPAIPLEKAGFTEQWADEPIFVC